MLISQFTFKSIGYLNLGGWNAGSGAYSTMATDPMKRKIFVDSLEDFLDQYDFDGVDLDWVSLKFEN